MNIKQKKGVWVGVEQLNNDPAYQELREQELNAEPLHKQLTNEKTLGVESSRRDFLKYLGFGLGAATVASSCEIPLKRAIPYVVKPDQIVPGVATYYASSFVQGGDYCSILVKTREGRPIKIEGNSLSSVTKGGTSARAQASVLSLYDTSRITGPAKIEDGDIDMPRSRDEGLGWEGLDNAVTGKLGVDAQIRIVTNTNMSPTFNKVLEEFIAKYPNTQVITYDPVSSAAMLQANEECFGVKAIPGYRFDKAEVIVSLDADFLGTWISPVEFAAQYATNRKIKNPKEAKLSRHVQIETHMSLTGSNADNRILVKPSEQGAAVIVLYNEVARVLGGEQISGGPKLEDQSKVDKIRKVARELAENSGKSLVVSGSNNIGEQTIVNAINNLLGNYGETLDFSHASHQRKGTDKEVQDLITEMNAGRVDYLFVMDGANPAYDIPGADQFADAMGKVPMKISFSTVPNETTLLCDYAAPTHHFLESWGDVEPKRGEYSLIQPTIAPLFNTRQTEETLLRWAGSENLDTGSDQPYFEYLKANWETFAFPAQNEFVTFQSFWDSALHDGVFVIEQEPMTVEFAGNVQIAAKKVRNPSNTGMEIVFYETVNMGGGQYANNPWLQEMPDPINRCVWGNYLAIPISWDGGNKFQAFQDLNNREIYGEADQVNLDVNGIAEKCTVVRQFGLLQDTLALAIGYGRKHTGLRGQEMGSDIGVNVYPWLSIDDNGNTQYYASVANVRKTGDTELLPSVQYHHTMGVEGENKKGETINVDEKVINPLSDPFNDDGFQGGLVDRSIIYQGKVEDLDELVHHIEEKRAEAEKLNSHTIYPYEEYKEYIYEQGHHWNMHVDLNACIGCGACQVACVAENNVPVVGRTEVARHHEMTWLRIDRYYYGDYENPNVVYQPMMCQHCDNAPCENVCPVAATNHSSEGLNQMTYNRCIGTRYCANNCPYKVRRFNWLDYTTADIFPANEYTVNGEELPFGADNLTRMVLNPDVTVRSRGVIEKCSFCVQRIQEGKLIAKSEQRALRDADVKTACQTACPTGAIVFGDGNNQNEELAERMKNPLNYLVLEEINTRPSVYYAAKVNNRDEELV